MEHYLPLLALFLVILAGGYLVYRDTQARFSTYTHPVTGNSFVLWKRKEDQVKYEQEKGQGFEEWLHHQEKIAEALTHLHPHH